MILKDLYFRWSNKVEKLFKKYFFLFILVCVFIKITSNDLIQSTSDIEQPDILDKKIAVIFGITGQDGCYLSKLLLEKGYKVYGSVRRASSLNTSKLFSSLQNLTPHVMKNLVLLYGDITDSSSVAKIIKYTKPNEIYNLAAQSHVKVSFEKPVYTAQVDAIGTLNILEAIRDAGLENKTRFYQASSSELYGKVQKSPQNEFTSFYPCSPYAVAKIYGYWITVNYREAYNIYACNGILFNHESPYRGENFVTRAITIGIARVIKGLDECISLGNLNSKRDWGFAGDYVVAMWLMLQQDKAEDYVISTGEVHSVREFVELSFREVGIEIDWHGEGLNEIGVDRATGKKLVSVDPKYFRPTEVNLLIGDSSKAKNKLGWKPKVSFKELVKMMIKNDIALLNDN